MNIIEKLGITPGPWMGVVSTHTDGKDYISVCCDKQVIPGFGEVVAICGELRGKNEKASIADSRLIAAAPEMLEALIDLARRKEYAAYNAYMENGWGDESEKKAVAEIKPYTDIIEKATGLEWEKVKEL